MSYRRRGDRKAVDGELAEGERLIRKGGRVKFAQEWWQHASLLPFVGQRLTVSSDYWRTEAYVWRPIPHRPDENPLLETIARNLNISKKT